MSTAIRCCVEYCMLEVGMALLFVWCSRSGESAVKTLSEFFVGDARTQQLVIKNQQIQLTTHAGYWGRCSPHWLCGITCIHADKTCELGTDCIADVGSLVIVMLVPYPQPWGIAIAGIMGFTVQLACSWVPPAARVDREE